MWKYLKKYWFYALLAPLFMIGEAGMDLLQPALMATIVDEGVLGIGHGGVGSLDIILKTGMQMVALIAAGGACGVLSGVFSNLAAQNFGNDMRKDAFRHIMHFSFSQTDRFTTGSLITRVTNDVTQVQNMVQMVIRGFVRTIILFAGGIFFMLRLDLSFGVVVLCAMPMIILVLIFFLSRITPRFTILQEKLDKVNNVVQENVTGSRVVKAYVQEDYEQGRFTKANDELVGTQMRILLLLNYMSPIMNIILNLSVLAVIWIGRIKVGDGSITPGSVMAAITYLSQILGALMHLGIERSCLGDIVLRDNVAYLFALERIAPYLCDSLAQVKHTSVACEAAAELPEGPLFRTEEVSLNVNSLRADCIVAAAYNLSRGNAEKLFAAQKVFINGRLTLSGAATLKEDDAVSVRGCGRFVYRETTGSSKKGRLFVTVERYV